MPNLLENPVSRLMTLLDRPKPRWILGLAGVPGSGKTTVVEQWAEAVNGAIGPGTMVALGMDGFHLTREQLRQFPDPEEAFARRGAPWTFNPAAMAKRLRRVGEAVGSADVAWPRFRHEIRDPEEGAFVVPAGARLILVEGLYLLHQDDGWAEVAACFDERWFLDTPVETSLERLAQRHMQVWDWTREQAEHRIATNDRLNAETVLRSREAADWVVQSWEPGDLEA